MKLDFSVLLRLIDLAKEQRFNLNPPFSLLKYFVNARLLPALGWPCSLRSSFQIVKRFTSKSIPVPYETHLALRLRYNEIL